MSNYQVADHDSPMLETLAFGLLAGFVDIGVGAGAGADSGVGEEVGEVDVATVVGVVAVDDKGTIGPLAFFVDAIKPWLGGRPLRLKGLQVRMVVVVEHAASVGSAGSGLGLGSYLG